MINGCRDDQTSADAWIDSQSQGAMTAALLFSLQAYEYNITCFDLLKLMRKYLQSSTSNVSSRRIQFLQLLIT